MNELTVGNAPKWEPKVQLVSVLPEAEKRIEFAYRTCWQSEPKGDRAKFIIGCIKKGHLSCLEFADAHFLVVASRAMTHQQVRHRIASYAQESQRYVRQGDPTRIVIPPTIYGNPAALDIFIGVMNHIWAAYTRLVELGIPKEDARYVLPNACGSAINVKTNFRAWRHYLKLRCAPAAQWEIRGVAKVILEILYSEAPSVFGDLYDKYILEKDVPLWTESD